MHILFGSDRSVSTTNTFGILKKIFSDKFTKVAETDEDFSNINQSLIKDLADLIDSTPNKLLKSYYRFFWYCFLVITLLQ